MDSAIPRALAVTHRIGTPGRAEDLALGHAVEFEGAVGPGAGAGLEEPGGDQGVQRADAHLRTGDRLLVRVDDLARDRPAEEQLDLADVDLRSRCHRDPLHGTGHEPRGVRPASDASEGDALDAELPLRIGASGGGRETIDDHPQLRQGIQDEHLLARVDTHEAVAAEIEGAALDDDLGHEAKRTRAPLTGSPSSSTPS